MCICSHHTSSTSPAVRTATHHHVHAFAISCTHRNLMCGSLRGCEETKVGDACEVIADNKDRCRFDEFDYDSTSVRRLGLYTAY